MQNAQKAMFKVEDVDTHQNCKCCLTHSRLCSLSYRNNHLIWTCNQCVTNVPILYILKIPEDLGFMVFLVASYKLETTNRNGLIADKWCNFGVFFGKLAFNQQSFDFLKLRVTRKWILELKTSLRLFWSTHPLPLIKR